MSNETLMGLLYEHEDGRYAVVESAELATFAKNDPKWHRVGPVAMPRFKSISTDEKSDSPRDGGTHP